MGENNKLYPENIETVLSLTFFHFLVIFPELFQFINNFTFISSSVRPSKEDPSFKVTLVNSTLWQNYGTPNMEGWLRMTWNSSLVESETIDVELWGYREVNQTIWPSSLKAEISYLYSLGKNISNTGNFSFFPEPKEKFFVWELGNIRISASSESKGNRYA